MRSWLMVICVLLLASVPAAAAPDQAYQAEARIFQKIPAEVRLKVLSQLALAGYLEARITASLTPEAFEAVRAFQQDRGWPVTGSLTGSQVDELEELTFPTHLQLHFTAQPHPTEKHPIWVPMGLGLKPEKTKLGTIWVNEGRDTAVSYRFVPKATLQQLRANDKAAAEEQSGRIVRDISAKDATEVLVELPDGTSTFTAYFRHRGGALGVSVLWKNPDHTNVMMRVATLAASSLGASLAKAPFPKPPGLADEMIENFRKGSAAWLAMSPTQRLEVQILLAASGHLTSPITADGLPRQLLAIAALQAENGLPDTGIIDDEVIGLAQEAATPGLKLWGFQELPHPTQGLPIWVPMGLGLKATTRPAGAVWKSENHPFHIYYSYYPSQDLREAFDNEIKHEKEARGTIDEAVLKQDSYLILSRTPENGRVLKAMHRRGDGVMGISAYWQAGDKTMFMDQVQLIMRGSLAAAIAGKAFPSPPGSESARPTADAPPPTEPGPPAGRDTPPAEPAMSSGTGFFISREGHVVTNAHVVEGCKDIAVRQDTGRASRAEVIAHDSANDLALLKTSFTGVEPARLRSEARLGEGVAAFGFPLAGTLSSSGNFTIGNITALSGLNDDSRHLQISAPVQPGNSGGPLLDMAGNVVGVVSAKLKAAEVAARNGDIPQNVNFAIKGAMAADFLGANDITPPDDHHTGALSPADLADRARGLSTFILCTQGH